MNPNSPTPHTDLIEKLKDLAPQAFTEGSLDKEKLLASLGLLDEFSNERYVLNWAGKSDCYRVIQTPSTSTLVPEPDESVNFDDTENLFIEGENLEVLKVLQKSYFGKVKMIYIDPPYNTGNDSFIYPDKFAESREEYQKRVGDKDTEGYMTREGMFQKNSKDSGHYHSNWLSMMYPRLFLARNLLKDDGVIFVSIDDNEVHNLRLIMNEIFGEENFVAELVWRKKVSPSNDSQWYSNDHEYIVIYAKNKNEWAPEKTKRTEKHNSYYKNPDDDPRGDWNSVAYTCNKSKSERPNLYYAIVNPFTGEEIYPDETAVWAYSKQANMKHIEENLLYWGKDGNATSPRMKKFLTNAKPVVPRSILDYQEVGSTQTATSETRDLFGGISFSYPKTVGLLKKVIHQGTTNDDIILDFFSGSATTAHAVLDLNREDSGNRRFIMVQLPEKTDETSEAHKAEYKTIADIGKERIRRVIKKIQEEDSEKLKLEDNTLDLGFKVFKLQESNFKQWQGNITTPEELDQQMLEFTDPLREGKSNIDIVYELMLKSGKDPNSSIQLIDNVYMVDDTDLAIILDPVTLDRIDQLIELKPGKIIALDRVFKDNDPLKTNTTLHCRDAGISFTCI